MRSLEKQAAFWDKVSPEYDLMTAKYEEIYNLLAEKTRKYLKPGDEVMDYACGTGSTTIRLARDVKRLHAVDISQGMLEYARLKASESQVENIDFIRTTLSDERFKPGSYDAVICFNVLHLLKDISGVINRIHQLLRPGGFFISTTACLGEKNTLRNLLMVLKSRMGLTTNIRMFSISRLEELVIKGNFHIVESETLDFTPTNHFIAAQRSL